MIRTSIILELDGKWPVWHQETGLAKNAEVANWLFMFCGWNDGTTRYPCLCTQQIQEDWAEIDPETSCDIRAHWVLGNRLLLN
ncbi:hypothetical protein [Spirosoma sp. KUDC1026]|uniref:hypothetical protein n=1 Tax=Spirosoma sp. KUDC1026 TaxID=2745947 RepID=UPI00159BD282|nr:hypothetical protein [Spirosoma sp. KUDC1026]QKZ12786.1 hypothetical protein HU175_09135 [Spirosoma sp. KUDC1026]